MRAWVGLLSLLLMLADARAHWGTPRAVPVLLIQLLGRHPGREKGREAAEEWCGCICCSRSWPGAAEPCTTMGDIWASHRGNLTTSWTVLGTTWSNEGAGYVGLLVIDHLVSLSKLVPEVCVCGQNSLLTSVRKLQMEASESQNLEFEPVGLYFSQFSLIYISIYIYLYIIYISI